MGKMATPQKDLPTERSDRTPVPTTHVAEPQVDIPNRPAAPVVIRFFGCDAEMVGVNKDFFTLGDSAECDVQFPAALRRDGQTVLRLGRAAEGWRLNCPTGITYYVNQEVVASSANLRSGDVIRMTPGGPGFQFTILNQNAEPLAKLAARYAPRLVQPAAESAPPALVIASNHQPRAASAAPPRPSAAPSRPTAPLAKSAAAVSRPAKRQQPRNSTSQRFARLLDYKSWHKSTKNRVVLVAALITIGFVIGLWPSSPPETNDTSPAAPKAASNTVESPSNQAPSQTDGVTPQAPATPPESGSS